MKFLKYLTILVAVGASFTNPLNAEAGVKREIRERDFQAVQEFVNSKRTIPMSEKDTQLTISGDIRFGWASVTERVNCQRLRGGSGVARQVEGTDTIIRSTDRTAGIPYSNNEFEVELNLYFDYVCDRSWGVAWLQFDNYAGLERGGKPCTLDPQGLYGSGTCEQICLKKAYMGYNICADGCSRFDIELGRRPLYNVFDSRVQFQSRFDGILFRYARNFGCYGDFYWNTGLFVIDERINHYGYVSELGILNYCGYGVDLKYSFIDWRSWLSDDTNRCGTKHPAGADYQISQITAHYNFMTDCLCTPVKIYGAFLYNHAARKREITDENKDNIAWYLGFIAGRVCREGDWAFDANYQVVEAQAIPDRDVSGIGDRSNVLRETFTADGRGFTNYRGWRFEALYALTDNLTIDAILEFLRQDRRAAGGKHDYSKFEVQAIYAF